MPYRSDRTPALVADVASEHPSVVGQVNGPDSLDERSAMLARTMVYVYAVLLGISLLLGHPVPLAITP
jgi:hypothetical protein